MQEFQLSAEYIELIKLLKHLHLVESGGQAKLVVEEGYVKVNGKVEFRKRKKLISGDIVDFEGNTVKLT